MSQKQPHVAHALRRQRLLLLKQLERRLDGPMVVLGFVWLALLVVDLTRGLGPLLQTISNVIWALFGLNFALEFTIAPRKGAYLRHNWLTLLSLLAPALRLLRLARLARLARATRVARGMRLLRIVSSVNRGLASLGSHMARRGLGYVLALSLIVTLAGSAGMYAFEHDIGGSGVSDYATALWWTAMIMTTMGSDYRPRSPEGRVLCLMLALYAFTVFGYVTAALASFFVGRDAEHQRSADVGLAEQLESLRAELNDLQVQLERFNVPSPASLPPSPPHSDAP